jgi:hypothetical protein
MNPHKWRSGNIIGELLRGHVDNRDTRYYMTANTDDPRWLIDYAAHIIKTRMNTGDIAIEVARDE